MRPLSAILFGCVLLTFAPLLSGDEIVVGQREHAAVGDFDCCGCPSQVTNSMAMLMADSSGTLTAGELWEFFSRQGISKLDELTICLDLEPGSQRQAFGLTGVELQIEDPQAPGQLLTNVSLGNNSLLVPDYEISAFKPEARLTVSLGYDFMERFSASSREKFRLRYSAAEADVTPIFSVEGQPAIPESPFSFSLLAGFVAFWIVVFVLLSRVTRSQIEPAASARVPATKSGQQALSV